ncbi:MAG: exosortase K [Clostridiales bacterium]|nr:exosortase K [Clostridiales bacterium]
MPAIRRFLKLYTWDILLGLLAIALGLAALWGFARAGDGALRVLLLPHAKTVEWFYHVPLVYRDGVGYLYSDAFSIGAACMGLNFIVMLFWMCVCVFTHRFRAWRKPVFFGAALVGSVLLGVSVSCIRILGSIPLIAHAQFAALHTGIGAALYLAALTGVYILLRKITGGLPHETHR